MLKKARFLLNTDFTCRVIDATLHFLSSRFFKSNEGFLIKWEIFYMELKSYNHTYSQFYFVVRET